MKYILYNFYIKIQNDEFINASCLHKYMIKKLSVETALELTKRIKDEKSYKWAIAYIVDCLAKAGEYDMVNLVAEDRPSLVVELAYDDEKKAIGFFEKDPLKYIWLIEHPGLSKDEKVKLLEKALKVAKEPEDYFKVALAYASLKLVDEALNFLNLALNGIRDEEVKVQYLRDLAFVLHENGYRDLAVDLFKRAFNIALNIADKEVRNCLLSILADNLTELGEFDLAMEIMEHIKDRIYLMFSLSYFIKLVYDKNANESYIEQAFRLAKTLKKVHRKTLIMDIRCDIDKLKAKVGDLRVRDLLTRLEKLARTIVKSGYRFEALEAIAESYAIIGDYDRALSIAKKIKQRKFRWEAIGYIAYRLAREGLTNEAKLLLENLSDGVHDTVDCYKALCYVRLRKIDEAKKIILSTSNEFMISRVISELIDIGRCKDAIELIKSLAGILAKNLNDTRYYVVNPIIDSIFAPDLEYKSISLIYKIISSDLDESEKIDLLNEIYRMAEKLNDYQSAIFRELAMGIAWYSLRGKIVERAKRLEEKGYIEKANELYMFAKVIKADAYRIWLLNESKQLKSYHNNI